MIEPATIIAAISASQVIVTGLINLAKQLHAAGQISDEEFDDIIVRGRKSDTSYNQLVEEALARIAARRAAAGTPPLPFPPS